MIQGSDIISAPNIRKSFDPRPIYQSIDSFRVFKVSYYSNYVSDLVVLAAFFFFAAGFFFFTTFFFPFPPA